MPLRAPQPAPLLLPSRLISVEAQFETEREGLPCDLAAFLPGETDGIAADITVFSSSKRVVEHVTARATYAAREYSSGNAGIWAATYVGTMSMG